jgi:hypothetical protein
MKSPRRPDRAMLVGAAVFIGVGLKMIVQGIVHTISGEPIAATTWTDETTGPEQLIFGLIGVALGGVVIRLAYRGPPPE